MKHDYYDFVSVFSFQSKFSPKIQLALSWIKDACCRLEMAFERVQLILIEPAGYSEGTYVMYLKLGWSLQIP